MRPLIQFVWHHKSHGLALYVVGHGYTPLPVGGYNRLNCELLSSTCHYLFTFYYILVVWHHPMIFLFYFCNVFNKLRWIFFINLSCVNICFSVWFFIIRKVFWTNSRAKCLGLVSNYRLLPRKFRISLKKCYLTVESIHQMVC